jgi:hypothetical protein
VDTLTAELRARSGANTSLSPPGPRETDLATRTATQREAATVGGAAATLTVRAAIKEAAPTVTEVGGSAVEDTRRACGNHPYRATRGKGGGSGRGGCSSHIGNGEQCGSGTNRWSATCRARGLRLCCYETKNRRNGDRNWCGGLSRPSNAGMVGGERRPSGQRRRGRARDGSGIRGG